MECVWNITFFEIFHDSTASIRSLPDSGRSETRRCPPTPAPTLWIPWRNRRLLSFVGQRCSRSRRQVCRKSVHEAKHDRKSSQKETDPKLTGILNHFQLDLSKLQNSENPRIVKANRSKKSAYKNILLDTYRSIAVFYNTVGRCCVFVLGLGPTRSRLKLGSTRKRDVPPQPWI